MIFNTIACCYHVTNVTKQHSVQRTTPPGLHSWPPVHGRGHWGLCTDQGNNVQQTLTHCVLILVVNIWSRKIKTKFRTYCHHHHDAGVRRRFHPRGGQTVSICQFRKCFESCVTYLRDDATCQGLHKDLNCYTCTPEEYSSREGVGFQSEAVFLDKLLIYVM